MVARERAHDRGAAVLGALRVRGLLRPARVRRRLDGAGPARVRRRWPRGRRLALASAAALAFLAAVVSGAGGAVVLGAARAAVVGNPVVVENGLPGSAGWDGGGTVSAGVLDGYASEVSVVPGGQVHLHVTGAVGVRYRVEVYRLGWYQGTGARLQQCVPSCSTDEAAAARPATAMPDPVTGYLDAGWPVSDVVTLGSSSVSGLYLAKLVVTAGGTVGEARDVTFVVREAAVRSPIVVQIGVNTDQAYNNWGEESLYVQQYGWCRCGRGVV